MGLERGGRWGGGGKAGLASQAGRREDGGRDGAGAGASKAMSPGTLLPLAKSPNVPWDIAPSALGGTGELSRPELTRTLLCLFVPSIR